MCSVLPTATILKTPLQSLLLIHCKENLLAKGMRISYGRLYSVPLTCVLISLTVACCFSYCSFAVCFDANHCDASGIWQGGSGVALAVPSLYSFT